MLSKPSSTKVGSLKEINRTLIGLIPKIEKLETANHCRPINTLVMVWWMELELTLLLVMPAKIKTEQTNEQNQKAQTFISLPNNSKCSPKFTTALQVHETNSSAKLPAT